MSSSPADPNLLDFTRCFENKTVAVTGSQGYLGAALGDALTRTSARPLLVSRRPAAAVAGADVFTGDVREKTCWQEIVHRADVVFHVAGNSSVYAAARAPADSLISTLLPLTHLLEAAREARRMPRVLFASTARVYGFIAKLPVAEDTDPHPVTPFGLHNLLAEHLLELASNQGVLEGISLRLGNVYGPSPCGSFADERIVLNKITRLAVRGSDLPLYGDGNYLRDYVYIDDVVRAFLMAGATPGIAGRSFNVASGRGITVRDAFHIIAERAARATGTGTRVHEVPWPDDEAPLECRDFTANIDRMSSACGWKPQMSFTEGIDRLIEDTINANVGR